MLVSLPRPMFVRVAGIVLCAAFLTITGSAVWTPGGWQQGGAQDPAVREMSDPLAPAVIPPEQKALDAALRITTVNDRLAALEKIRLGYPKSPLLNVVDAQVLAAVLQLPDSEDSASEVLDRMVARIPATASADARFTETLVMAARLIGRKVLLDRAEALLTGSLAAPALSRENRAAARYQLGRLYQAKGDVAHAEAEYKAAAAGAPPAVSALVAMYLERGERPKAEAFLLDVIKTPPVNMAALTSLTNLYKSDPARSEAILLDAVSRDPMLPGALLQLARLEQQRGDDARALDHFLKASALAYLRGPDADGLKTLFAKVHGTTNGLDGAIDERYRALPPALHADPYIKSDKRTNRLVVLEMFTGSACPPCVAADLAFDAALERYPADAIIPLAYHVHIPGPDPMTTPEGNGRRLFYSVNGVPAMQVDGALVANPATGQNFGGGGRDRAGEVYGRYVGLIDKALERDAGAAVAVQGALSGGKVTITANVTALPTSAVGLRLHIVLAEKALMFGGENGMRAHQMVVRGAAGDKGEGLPITAAGPIQHTFTLAEIREAITRSLAGDIARRRAASGDSPQTFAAEDRAMTAIDTSKLVAVAFIQTSTRQILQAARADVVVK